MQFADVLAFQPGEPGGNARLIMRARARRFGAGSRQPWHSQVRFGEVDTEKQAGFLLE
jgi:hypothetical protein